METSINVAKGIIQRVAETNINRVKAGETPYHMPVSMHSAPGVGKSSIVRQVADSLGIPMMDIRLVAMEAADVQGIPFVKGKGDSADMDFSTPMWFPTPDDESLPEDHPRRQKFGILFFDEITNAPRAVQQAAYRIILDREVQNGQKLPDGWVIVAAGNRKQDKTGSGDMPPALSNRFAAHLHIRPDKDDFLAYAARVGIHHHVSGFISFKPSNLHVFDPKKNTEEAFPTPRSWEYVSQHLELGYDEDELPLVIAGCIGEGAAHEFTGFRRYYSKLPDFEKIMAGKTQYEVPLKDNPGVIFALVSSLLGYTMECVVSGEKDKLENLGKVVAQLPDEYLSLFFKQYKSAFLASQEAGNIPETATLTSIFRSSTSMQKSFGRVHKYLKK